MTKVLVVEDNPANMTLSTFLLESAGHSVLKATDAETGVALARAEHPDLILMDIQLPGMDGLCATALLKGARAAPPVAGPGATATSRSLSRTRIFWQRSPRSSRKVEHPRQNRRLSDESRSS